MDFLPSLGAIFLLGLALGQGAKKLSLPPILGYLLTGMILGVSGFQILGETLTEISPHLRKIPLLMILAKAGLNLSWERLKKVGRPSILLSFCPAIMEILSCILFAPLFFGISLLESAILGSVLAAVSPAVVVPRMVDFIQRGIGKK